MVSRSILRNCAGLMLAAAIALPGAAEAGSGKRAGKGGKPRGRGASMQPLSAFELQKYQYCGNDKDCVLAQNGCCDCANGGQDIAINKDRTAAFQARFDCLHTNCGEKIGDPPCASGVISCINHKCKYFAEAPKAKPKPTPAKKKKEDEDDEDE